MTTTIVSNQTGYPYSTIVYVQTLWSDGTKTSGSGVVVGINDVLTAAHVIYDPGKTATLVSVTPAFNPNVYFQAYSNYYPVTWKYYQIESADGHLSQSGSQYDVAVLNFSVPIGYSTGWMGIRWNFTSGNVHVTGYPGFYQSNMTDSIGTVSKDPNYTILSGPTIEVHPGNSGGPVWTSDDYVVGIVSTGSSDNTLAAAALLGGVVHDFVQQELSSNDSEMGIVHRGTSASDLFVNTNGVSDYYDGGVGTDTVQYQYARSSYNISFIAHNSLGVEAIIKGISGQDVLFLVERLRFADGTLALDTEAGQVAGEAYRLYRAAFDRTPDSEGLSYWIKQMDSGVGMTEVAARFIDSAEFRSLYGTNPSNGTFITKLYNNVLDRTPDTAGFNYWLDQMSANPEKTPAKVLADFTESNENIVGVASQIHDGIWLA